jgi:hypothetical protein
MQRELDEIFCTECKKAGAEVRGEEGSFDCAARRAAMQRREKVRATSIRMTAFCSPEPNEVTFGV